MTRVVLSRRQLSGPAKEALWVVIHEGIADIPSQIAVS